MDEVTELSDPVPASSVTTAAVVEAARNSYKYIKKDEDHWVLVRHDKKLRLKVNPRAVDSPEILETFTAKRHLTYTLLSDPKSEIIDRYNLRDPQYPPGNRAYGVPKAIIFVLDPQGVIKAKLFEDNFKYRPRVTTVISKLDELGGRSGAN